MTTSGVCDAKLTATPIHQGTSCGHAAQPTALLSILSSEGRATKVGWSEAPAYSRWVGRPDEHNQTVGFREVRLPQLLGRTIAG